MTGVYYTQKNKRSKRWKASAANCSTDETISKLIKGYEMKKGDKVTIVGTQFDGDKGVVVSKGFTLKEMKGWVEKLKKRHGKDFN